MRGWLRITSSRAPYRRAGLAFAIKGPVDVDIRILNGERFLRLVKDPVLTIKVGQEDGTFVPLPQMPDGVTAEDLQLVITSMVEELPDLPAAPLDPVLADGRTLEGLADRLKEAGVATIDELFDKLAETTASLDAETATSEALTVQIEQCRSALTERDNELRQSRERVAELEAAVNAASSSQPTGESPDEEQPQETKPAPRKAAAKKG